MKLHHLLTKPIKRADGGFAGWSDIDKALTPHSVAPIYSSMDPVGAPSYINPNRSPLPINPPEAGGGTSFSAITNGLGKGMNDLMPFASNIINSFRTPPRPALPTTDNYVSLQAPSFANDRTEAAREINSTTETSARNVDGNTGAKIRLFGLGQKLERFSSINQAEHNSRTNVLNEQSRINSGISMRNNEKMDQFNDKLTERSVAQQREQSANVANASDKFIGIQNEKRKAQVDLDKTKTMASLFSTSGVGKRSRAILKSMGVPDPEGMEYSDLEDTKKANGGSVPRRAFYRNLQGRAQTLKSLYKAPR